MKSAFIRVIAITILYASLCAGVFFYDLSNMLHTYHTYTVVRTNTSFIPNTLTVPKGSTIIFENRSSTFSWPASDLHPSHYIYPEFDPKQAYGPGESWAFTFQKKGTWAFHDHLASHVNGLVTVTDSRYEERKKHVCGESTDQNCLNTELSKAFENGGLARAFEFVKTNYTSDEKFAIGCHRITHDIGLRAYRFYKIEVPIIPETGFCNSGFYHGYMEGFLNDAFDPSVADAFCDKVGNILRESFPNAENQCRHGIGHGAEEYVIYANPFLWDDPLQLIQKALDVCTSLPHSYEQNMRCASGVMNVFADWALSETTFSSYLTDDIYHICTELDAPYAKEACYWEFSKRVLTLSKYKNPVALKRFQTDFPTEESEQQYKAQSIWSIAIRIGYSTIHEPNSYAINLCKTLQKDLYDSCIGGVTEGILIGGEPNNEEARALSFCSSSLLTEETQKSCYRVIQNWLDSIYDEKGERPDRTCPYIPDAFKIETICR